MEMQKHAVERLVATVQCLMDHANEIFDVSSLLLLARNLEQAAKNDVICHRNSGTENVLPHDNGTQHSPSAGQDQALPSISITPIPPPRRKRSSVVCPPIVSIAKEMTNSSEDATLGDHSPSAAAAAAAGGGESRPMARSLSSESEFSTRDYSKQYQSMESTDGEMIELEYSGSCDETEDEPYGKGTRSSEDLADDEDVLSPPHKDRQDFPDHLEQRVLDNLDEAADDVDLPQAKGYSPRTGPHSSTDDPDSGGLVTKPKRQFFTSSFGSTGGSDADLSTFGESIDGGMTFLSFEGSDVHLVFHPSLDKEAVVEETWKEKEVDTQELDSVKYKDNGNEEQRPDEERNFGGRLKKSNSDTFDTGASRPSDIDASRPTDIDVSGPNLVQSTSCPACDTCDSGVSLSSAAVESHTVGEITDSSYHVESPVLLRAKDATAMRSPLNITTHRHSLDSPSLLKVDDRQGRSDVRQRRGMTHKGSDFYPAHLSRTLRVNNNSTRLSDPNAFDYDSMSGTESGSDVGFRRIPLTHRLALDERVIMSDIELDDVITTTKSPRETSRRVGITKKPKDFHQMEDDSKKWEGHLTTEVKPGQDKMSDATEGKGFDQVKLRTKPPKYEETMIQQLKRPNSSTELQTMAKGMKEQEGSSVDLEKHESSERSDPTRHKNLGSVGTDRVVNAVPSMSSSRSCGDLSKYFDRKTNTSTSSIENRSTELKHGHSVGTLSTTQRKHSKPLSRRRTICSSSSSSDEGKSLPLRDDDDQTKKKRRPTRRPRRARNSDTRLQTDRQNRVNLVRSKSDSNTLARPLIIKNQDFEQDLKKVLPSVPATKGANSQNVRSGGQNSKENLGNSFVDNTKESRGQDSTCSGASITSADPSTLTEVETPPSRRKPVTLKGRDWHKELVEEMLSNQSSGSNQTLSNQSSVSNQSLANQSSVSNRSTTTLRPKTKPEVRINFAGNGLGLPGVRAVQSEVPGRRSSQPVITTPPIVNEVNSKDPLKSSNLANRGSSTVEFSRNPGRPFDHYGVPVREVFLKPLIRNYGDQKCSSMVGRILSQEKRTNSFKEQIPEKPIASSGKYSSLNRVPVVEETSKNLQEPEEVPAQQSTVLSELRTLNDKRDNFSRPDTGKALTRSASLLSPVSHSEAELKVPLATDSDHVVQTFGPRRTEAKQHGRISVGSIISPITSLRSTDVEKRRSSVGSRNTAPPLTLLDINGTTNTNESISKFPDSTRKPSDSSPESSHNEQQQQQQEYSKSSQGTTTALPDRHPLTRTKQKFPDLAEPTPSGTTSSYVISSTLPNDGDGGKGNTTGPSAQTLSTRSDLLDSRTRRQSEMPWSVANLRSKYGNHNPQ